MTKKDYELFANEIHNTLVKDHYPVYADHCIELCQRVFAKDNIHFNALKFADACRQGKHIRKSIRENV